MTLEPLFALVDARPFQPFTIELLSGRLVPVTHPENIFVLPNRQKVAHVEVFQESGEIALFYPEGLVALHRNGKEDR